MKYINDKSINTFKKDKYIKKKPDKIQALLFNSNDDCINIQVSHILHKVYIVYYTRFYKMVLNEFLW
jgi:hypothetical protein